jgi:hypothetical protein
MKNTIENSKQEDETKALLLKYHTSNEATNDRIDIPKILDDYQSKFSVPKVMIMKWLNLNCQKSLFKQEKFKIDLSQSCVSQESEFSKSDVSLVKDLKIEPPRTQRSTTSVLLAQKLDVSKFSFVHKY